MPRDASSAPTRRTGGSGLSRRSVSSLFPPKLDRAKPLVQLLCSTPTSNHPEALQFLDALLTLNFSWVSGLGVRLLPFQRFCRLADVAKLLKQFRDPRRSTNHPSEEGC